MILLKFYGKNCRGASRGCDLYFAGDSINLGFVLGNKVVVGTVNANREHFEAAVKDLAQCEFQWPGWLAKLLTHRIRGLESSEEIPKLLAEAKGAVKILVDLSGS
ncbi:MAG: hypothetical protein AB9866_13970 [Syntrophobacteraceae bacterium]